MGFSLYCKKLKEDGSIDYVYSNSIYELTINHNQQEDVANVNMQIKVGDNHLFSQPQHIEDVDTKMMMHNDQQVVNQLVSDLTESNAKLNSLLNVMDFLVQQKALPLEVLEYAEKNVGFVSDEALRRKSKTYIKK